MDQGVAVPGNEHEIMRAIGRLEGKVDSLIADAREDSEARGNHEKRIAILEKRQYGIFLVGGIVGTVLLTTLKSIVNYFTGS